MIFPDSTLGVLGGGQLGRMFCMAAHSMGYRVWVLDPDPDSPAGAIADRHLQAGYTDHAVLEDMAEHCAAVTTEFENVPAETLEFLEAHTRVRPGSRAVAIARDRILEKTFIREQGLATAPFFAIQASGDLQPACDGLRMPALLKTAQLGYDGKGQFAVNSRSDAEQGFLQLQQAPCVLEERVDLAREFSVILARSVRGDIAIYPPGENVHVNGILDTTCVPAGISPETKVQAEAMAVRLAEAMQYCGVLAVEFFLSRDGQLLINEMAPRPHNSGHYTLDAALTSQFEQQVRSLCGLPPGSTELLSPVVMVNLLGDLWEQGTPCWERLFAHPEVKLHLYGKHQARPGRKMGHYNCLAKDPSAAQSLAQEVRAVLVPGQQS
ncbi:MAG TPA: 5-(carboxyamino)imidazole ribonucleotide synthase [Gammaproteobacteria bacterium]|nr:5-(carboxyamino)imidazole ribonucleotide synthase [Gammaproteobacteria bacterium]